MRWRRTISGLLILCGLAVLWFAFAVVTPFALSHQPGPANPSFAWYVTYRSIPVLLLAAEFVLFAVAWRLWRP